jgi:hypothetical protein
MEARMKELLKDLKRVIVSRLIASSNGRLKRPKEEDDNDVHTIGTIDWLLRRAGH